MRARGRAGRGAVGPGRSPPGCQCRRGAAAAPPGTARPQLPGPGGDVRAEPGTGIMNLVISLYPVEVTVLPVTAAGVPRGAGGGLEPPGPAGMYRGLGTLRDGAVPDSPGCPFALHVPAAFCCQRVNDRNRSERNPPAENRFLFQALSLPGNGRWRRSHEPVGALVSPEPPGPLPRGYGLL